MSAPSCTRGAQPSHRADAVALGMLVLAWCATLPIIGLGGEFPLNDDWAYAQATWRFVETGALERVRWTWAPIVTHAWLGAAATKLFGQGFAVLRAASFATGLLGVLACYGLARAQRLPPRRSALVAATFGFCPVYLNLAYTFMTDVPFTTLLTAGLAACAAGLRARGARAALFIALGAAALLAATLSRQPGAAAAAALVAGIVVERVRSLRAAAVLGGALAVGGAAAALIARLVMGEGDSGGMPLLGYLLDRVLTSPGLPYFVVSNTATSIVYLGWLGAPVALLLWPPAAARTLGAVSAAAALGLPLLLARLGRPLPPGINLIHDFGLGAPTLAGAEQLPGAPAAFWWLAEAVGAALGSWLLGCLAIGAWRRRREWLRRADVLMLLLFPAIYLGVLFLRQPFFDRYLSAVLPPLLVLALLAAGAERPAAWRRVTAGAALLGIAAFSVLGTRDYMERHRARARLLARLERAGIAPSRIDGGFEYAGWHNFGVDADRFLRNPRRWVIDDEYLLTWQATRPGYSELEHIRVWRWLPPRHDTLYLLHRDAGPRPAAPASPAAEPDR